MSNWGTMRRSTAPAKHISVFVSFQALFAGMSRVARHRAVNELLTPELKAGLHALAIEPAAPGEPTRW